MLPSNVRLQTADLVTNIRIAYKNEKKIQNRENKYCSLEALKCLANLQAVIYTDHDTNILSH